MTSLVGLITKTWPVVDNLEVL